jgi:hypothetical protein
MINLHAVRFMAVDRLIAVDRLMAVVRLIAQTLLPAEWRFPTGRWICDNSGVVMSTTALLCFLSTRTLVPKETCFLVQISQPIRIWKIKRYRSTILKTYRSPIFKRHRYPILKRFRSPIFKRYKSWSLLAINLHTRVLALRKNAGIPMGPIALISRIGASTVSPKPKEAC